MKNDKAQDMIAILTTLFTGLMAGLLFAWQVSVIPGIRKLNDAGYLAAMQQMNKAIQNPVFLLVFLGAPALLIISAWLQYRAEANNRFWLLLAAVIIYLAGVLAVTALGNIPLNNKLEAFNINGATPEHLQNMRASFETRWNPLHLVRTIAAVTSFILLAAACLRR